MGLTIYMSTTRTHLIIHWCLIKTALLIKYEIINCSTVVFTWYNENLYGFHILCSFYINFFYKDSSYWCYYDILQYTYNSLRSNPWIVRILVQILCLLYFTKIRCKYVNFRQWNIFHYAKQIINRKEFLNIRVNHFELVHICQFTTIYDLVY